MIFITYRPIITSFTILIHIRHYMGKRIIKKVNKIIKEFKNVHCFCFKISQISLILYFLFKIRSFNTRDYQYRLDTPLCLLCDLTSFFSVTLILGAKGNKRRAKAKGSTGLCRRWFDSFR